MELTQKQMDELKEYIVSSIEDYELECRITWGRIDRYHLFSVEQTNYQLHEQIMSCIEDWCMDEELDIAEYDWNTTDFLL